MNHLKKFALVIGIKKYEKIAPLVNTENDAKDICDVLIRMDFEVELLIDPIQKELIHSIINFKKKIDTNCVSLIFYAGHGIQLDGYNFLVPRDAEISFKEEIPYFCVNVTDCLIETLDLSSIHILILDACRNNPFGNGVRTIAGGLSKMEAPGGSLIAFSTSPNRVSIERDIDRNGVYTGCLLKHISTPNLSLESVFKKTRTDVIKLTNRKQVPWEESSLHGEDFCFIKKHKTINHVLKRKLYPLYEILAKRLILFTIIGTTTTMKIPFSEALVLFKAQYELNKDTIHPVRAFYIIKNLMHILYTAWLYSVSTKTVNFDEINLVLISMENDLTDKEFELYQRALTVFEHLGSIYEHNDQFENLKSVHRLYKKGMWQTFALDKEIVKDQSLVMEDLVEIKEKALHLDEFFKSKELIDIMIAFFGNEGSVK